ncbi:hypothetical protein IVA80_31045 [Bradyrhizobium sp. 139]|uniref:hypothetical protein n=1 Tax=Bradyrhizobium sp. 139 TaxID=2782616 RepID=UPI001FF899EA|nr:hypothetical protein [Bradyrhizobium sp. 139]MCK1745132.1 hypothetical protein [Bradyrhizobium sp. 139]
MIDEKIVRLSAHQKNIERYVRLLQTTLTEVERQYIERRLTEEQSATARLSASSLQMAIEAKVANRACNCLPSFNAAE